MMKLVKEAYRVTFKAIRSNPVIFLPFAIFAIFELISLIILYLAVRMPLVLIFGPPIRVFWGERFLHYPINFLLLAKLTALSRLALSIISGSFLTGVAVGIILHIYNQKKILRLANIFKLTAKHYASLFLIVFITTTSFFTITKVMSGVFVKYFMFGRHAKLLFIPAGIWFGPIQIALNFVLAILIHSLLVYAIPILIIEKCKLFKSLVSSVAFFKKTILPTFVLVGLPMIAYLPIIIFKQKATFFMNTISPEFNLVILTSGIMLNSLFVDLLITISTAYLYLNHRQNKE